MYQIYTFPACDKCHRAAEIFREKGIGFEEISAASLDGRTKLKEFSKQYRDKIRKDGKGWLVLPLIVRREESDVRIYQGEEGLAEVLEENESIKSS